MAKAMLSDDLQSEQVITRDANSTCSVCMMHPGSRRRPRAFARTRKVRYCRIRSSGTPERRVPLIRNPQLDGIRGIAILAVLGVHTGMMNGGGGGVDIFFVLSGFLITSILLREHEKTGRIGLGTFTIGGCCGFSRAGGACCGVPAMGTVLTDIQRFDTEGNQRRPVVLRELAQCQRGSPADNSDATGTAVAYMVAFDRGAVLRRLAACADGITLASARLASRCSWL